LIKNFNYSEIVGVLLVKKLLQLVKTLKYNLLNKINIYKLDFWEDYFDKKEYLDIQNYIVKGCKHL
jgi:hypothetical protein